MAEIGPVGAEAAAMLGSSAMGDADLARLRNAPAKEVAREFEAMLVAQMIQAMRKTLPNGGLGIPSNERMILDGVFDQEMAKSLLEGEDLGVAAALTREISPEKKPLKAPAQSAELDKDSVRPRNRG